MNERTDNKAFKLTRSAMFKLPRPLQLNAVLDGRDQERRGLPMTRRTERALRFAVSHFATCDVHLAAARAVYEQVEYLAKHEVPSLALDDRIGDVLGYSGAALVAAADSLEHVELQMALEEEMAVSELVQGAEGLLDAERVLAALLGPCRPVCSWDPLTVWLRSVRGIVNERVRHGGACTCVPIAVPSNNKMQLTSPG